MCESCRFKILYKHKYGSPQKVAKFIARTCDIIAKPLPYGDKLDVQIFEVKHLI